jgi:hypothetical protein
MPTFTSGAQATPLMQRAMNRTEESSPPSAPKPAASAQPGFDALAGEVYSQRRAAAAARWQPTIDRLNAARAGG